MAQNYLYTDTSMYDASRNWSDAQWARFLRCNKKDIPSIRNYMLGNYDNGTLRFLSGCFIEKQSNGYDWHWHFADFYWKSSQKPFKTYEEAERFSKYFLTCYAFNKTQQKMFNVPEYAAMMMSIYGER